MISIVIRRLTEPVEIGGYELPAGVSVPPGTYTWIPFGGSVRRCLGASFAQFEMAAVLKELVKRRQIRPADPRPERIFRRASTATPRHTAKVLLS